MQAAGCPVQSAVQAQSVIVRLPYTGVMRIWIDLPDDVIEQLGANGPDLSRSALEALAIDAYRM